MESLLDILVPPFIGFIGIHSIYKTWKYGRNIQEIEDALIIPDDRPTSKVLQEHSAESGAYVAVSGRLLAPENAPSEVISTRRKVENIDKLFSTIESSSPVRVRHCRLERSLGRSLKAFGRSQKEQLVLEAPHKACGFESLFTETKVIDVAQRHTLLNTQILRVTEEALLAGLSVTVLAQLDVHGGEFFLRVPLAWHRLFVISSHGVQGVLEDLREELATHRRTVMVAAVALLMYVAARPWFDINRVPPPPPLPPRHLAPSRSYDHVELDTDSPCVVCFEVQPEVLLIDCGHAVLCQRCAQQVTSCPVCRADICQPPCRIFLS